MTADTNAQPLPASITPPSILQMSLGLAVGSIGLLMLGLQPLLLGTLVAEGRLTVDQLGLAATAELLALGLTMAVLAPLLKPAHVKWINAAGCAALALANMASVLTSGFGFVAARGVAGIAAGFLVWVAVVMVTRARVPDRIAGVFFTVQTLAQAALAAVLPITAMVKWGANGGLGALAALAAAAIPASLLLQDRFADLPKHPETKASLPWAGLAALVSVFLYMAGIVGLWVFVEPLGAAAGASAQVAGYAVAAALAAQVAGSSAATFLSSVLPTVPMLAFCSLGNITVLAVLGTASGQMPFFIGVLAFGFLWLFALPFQTRLLIRLDPTRRAAMLLSPAQLLGCAAGPSITAAFATDTSLRGALIADAVLFGVGVLVTLSLRPKKEAVRT